MTTAEATRFASGRWDARSDRSVGGSAVSPLPTNGGWTSSQSDVGADSMLADSYHGPSPTPSDGVSMVGDLEEKNARLRKALALEKKKHAADQRRVEELMHALESLEAALQEKEVTISHLVKAKVQLEERMDAFRDQLRADLAHHDKKSKISRKELLFENNSLKDQVRLHLDDIESLRHDVASKERILEDMRQVNALKHEILQNQWEESTEKLAQAEKKLKAVDAQSRRLNEQVSELLEQKRQVEIEKQMSEAQVQELLAAIAEKDLQLAGKDSKIARYEYDIERWKERELDFLDLQTQHTDLEAKVSAMEAELRAREAEIDKLRRKSKGRESAAAPASPLSPRASSSYIPPLLSPPRSFSSPNEEVAHWMRVADERAQANDVLAQRMAQMKLELDHLQVQLRRFSVRVVTPSGDWVQAMLVLKKNPSNGVLMMSIVADAFRTTHDFSTISGVSRDGHHRLRVQYLDGHVDTFEADQCSAADVITSIELFIAANADAVGADLRE